MIEHRLFTRYRVEGEVLLQCAGPKPETIRAELVDMSFRGFGVYSPKAIDANTTVRFYISGKYFEKHLRGEGKIMYSQSYRRKETDVFRMGVEFISVDSDQVRDGLDRLRKEHGGEVGEQEK
ncbi:MAG: PilZ domain-containing protein [Candidatus Omnitrophica bacterium]|nr:PilZ domain-containing protein [Candidatus Omnitrophota bacterium]